MTQAEMSAINRAAWNADTYDGWLKESGTPVELAARLEPRQKLRRVLRQLGEVSGKWIANPLGSVGKAGVALALLGADVTVFDISESNARYGRELAAAAGVNLEYEVGDFMALEVTRFRGAFDAVLMELGILHWFLDLNALAELLFTISKPGARLVINDFHPIPSKLLSRADGRIEADRDYFDAVPGIGKIPLQAFMTVPTPDCLTRRWMLGEIVTAFARHGFRILELEETPGWDWEAHVPGLFTLTAARD